MMRFSKLFPAVVALFVLSTMPLAAQDAGTVPGISDSTLSPQGASYGVQLRAEIGWVKVLANTIQIGDTGTLFNYVTQGGEELLFPYSRYEAELTLAARNHFVLLYQPLLLETQTRIPDARTVKIDDVTFAGGTDLSLKYSFPFWRVSYLFDVANSPRFSLGVGASLQFRNASIVFQDASGSPLTISQNLGPVPILKVRAHYGLPSGLFFEADVDGFYASSAFLNGASFSFEGSILDASLRAGLAMQHGIELYLNTRFIGGTAVGNSQYAGVLWTDSRASYTDSKLATLAVTIGATVR